MLVKVYGAKCIGIDAVPIVIEVEINRGIGISMVGLADVAVKESLLRTTTALQSLEYRIPGKKIVINLAPADLQKRGSGYDLPIALGIVAASGQCSMPLLEKYLIMGELGLDGSVRPVSGALPMVDLAESEGLEGVILPLESALETLELRKIPVYGVRNLTEVVRILEGEEDCSDLLITEERVIREHSTESSTCESFAQASGGKSEAIIDFADIIGQEAAKRAIEIASSGGHNLILVGSPGSGKSSLAKAMAGILPPMTGEESVITSKIYSVAGKGGGRLGMMRERPFRAPHYSATLSSLIGGGSGELIVPGEISLAHNGVLFLDELAQMPRPVIEALRGPLEDRKVTICRLRAKVEYPASFMLVAASNPCPCGWWGEGDRCVCSPTQRLNYLSKLSGPIMERIDLHCVIRSVPGGRILRSEKPESSAVVAARVLKARLIQQERFSAESISCNAEMSNKQIEKYCPLSEECLATLGQLMERMKFSMRSYFRIIKVSRTIADMDGSENILPRHLNEAAGYRFLDKAGC